MPLSTADVPDNNEYKNPENYGFVGGRNFYLTTKDEATIGVWWVEVICVAHNIKL